MNQRGDLATRIETQLRERLEEVVDFVCLEALVERRRALGLPAPAADSVRDREEFQRSVHAFLEHLRASLAADLAPEQRRRVEAAERGAGEGLAGLLAVQVVLAREFPDYWQRFEASWATWSAAAPGPGSGGERRGLLGRLFGGG